MIAQEFRDELRARTPMAALVGRRVKLSRSGRHFKGCCPFHEEKSPSFYVYEDGFHCFGCSAHGDAIEFVMRSEGASFVEAVEKLAAEAGLEVPKASLAEEKAERKRLGLLDILAHAQEMFAQNLFTPEGAEGLAYLRRRGLTPETIRGFGLGWAGGGRGSLMATLAAKGVTPAQAQEAGLLRSNEDGSAGGELFFNRVMFPIRDRQGKIRSFGGRILGDGQPKYVNGPETPVFSKRRMLFGLDRARAGVASGASLIVVEGYMDVIALHQAGFTGAVAPLGTALTEEQIAELWRVSPLPVLCFDGDRAGAKATARAMLAALPHLTPEHSLRAALLSGGDDPDSLVTREGPASLRAALEAAEPLDSALFRLLGETASIATPEAAALFERRLLEAAASIRDPILAREYRDALRARLRDFKWTQKRRGFDNRAPRGGLARPSAGKLGRGAGTPPLARGAVSEAEVAAERGRVLCATILNHPGLIASVAEAWMVAELPPWLAGLRAAILAAPNPNAAGEELDAAALADHLTGLGLAQDVKRALGERPFPLPLFARVHLPPAAHGGAVLPVPLSEAGAGWWHIWGLMHPARLDEEVAAALAAYLAGGGEAARLRWQGLAAERERAQARAVYDGPAGGAEDMAVAAQPAGGWDDAVSP